MKRGEVAHHSFVLLLLVGVDGLRMLAEVVETRKLFGTVARKRALASVFPKNRGEDALAMVKEERAESEEKKKSAH